MRRMLKKVVLVVAFTGLATTIASGGPEVVANATLRNGPVDRATVRAIFFGSVTRWDNGKPIVVYVLQADHPTTKSFAWNVLRVTPYAFEEKISSLVASRDGNVPQVLSSEAEMLRAVTGTPNSIGYLSSFVVINNASNNLRVVPIL